jgi:poly(hydroxyalkanoate) granule-associated protein
MTLKNDLNQRFETLKNEVGTVAADLRGNSRRLWLAGLGALSTVDQRSRQAFDELVEKGEVRRQRLDAKVDETVSKVKEFQGDVEQQIGARLSRTLERIGVPTGAQLRHLIDSVEQLNTKIEKLARG